MADEPRVNTGLAPLVLRLVPWAFCFLPSVLLWRLTLHPTGIVFAPQAMFSDLLISHLPNAQYIHDSLTQFGQLPLWQTRILAGQPFAADPLAGLWYPPNWLTFAWPVPLMFNILFGLHLAWTGLGLHGFLRDEGLSDGAALLGGLAFAGAPKLIAHLAAGHVSLVFAVAWTPWLLRAVRRAVEFGGVKRGALAGACLALLFCADVRWAFYAAALGAAYWMSLLPPFTQRRSGGLQWRSVLAFALFFLMLSAGLALPLAEFIQHSDRQALTLADAGAYSLPVPYLLGLLIPDPHGYHEWMTYLGLAPLALAFVGLTRRAWFWGAAVLVAALFSLGVNFPLFPFLFRILPGLGYLRVPPRAWFIVALGVAVLAAHGLQRLLNAKRWPPQWLIAVALIATTADLFRVSSGLFVVQSMPAPSPAAEWIAAHDSALYRVYSPNYQLPQPDGLQHADGVNPLHLRAYSEYMGRASGLPMVGYDVTVPPYPGENASEAAATPSAELLGALNVKYVAVNFPLRAPGFVLAQTVGEVRLYENLRARPRAWLEPSGEAATIEYGSPNRITVRATGAGQLVLSEMAYPGWQARVDGAPAVIETVAGLLRGVTLSTGAHTIEFEFWPRWFFLGAFITGAGWLALGGVCRWSA